MTLRTVTAEGGWKSQLLFKFLCTQFKSHLLTLCCGGSQRAMSKQLNRKRKKIKLPDLRSARLQKLINSPLPVSRYFLLSSGTNNCKSLFLCGGDGTRLPHITHTLAWNSGVQQCGNKQDSSSHTCLTTLSPWEPFYISSTPHCAGSVPPPPLPPLVHHSPKIVINSSLALPPPVPLL